MRGDGGGRGPAGGWKMGVKWNEEKGEGWLDETEKPVFNPRSRARKTFGFSST